MGSPGRPKFRPNRPFSACGAQDAVLDPVYIGGSRVEPLRLGNWSPEDRVIDDIMWEMPV